MLRAAATTFRLSPAMNSSRREMYLWGSVRRPSEGHPRLLATELGQPLDRRDPYLE
jgi:hypothetical protein